MLQVWQQLSGINTAMYYGPEILRDAGFGGDDPRTVLIQSVPLGAINFVGTLVALRYTDKLGRRAVMLRVLPLIALSMAAISCGMFLVNFTKAVGTGQGLSLAALLSYLFFFAIGMGSQPWTVNSEIYAVHVRGTATALATTANWVSNYAIAAVFLTTTSSPLGRVLTYLVIAGFCMAAFAFIYMLLPETRGRSVEEIVQLFLNPHRVAESKHTDPESVWEQATVVLLPSKTKI